MENISSSSKAAYLSRWFAISKYSLAAACGCIAAAFFVPAEYAAVPAAAGLLCAAAALFDLKAASHHIAAIEITNGIATIHAAVGNAKSRHIVPAHQVQASISRVAFRVPRLWKLQLDHSGSLLARQFSIEDWSEPKLREAAAMFERARAAAE